jgi:G3E family GTPase
VTVALDVLGGFLGAGKTATINRLLSSAPVPIGVIVNDFGAVNVDEALIAQAGGDVVGLTNGCVCCAVGDDLGGAIGRLRQAAPAVTRIVVEASGVGDPRRIAQIARLERDLAHGLVIVAVNVRDLAGQLADPYLADTVQRQLARADRCLLTHADVVPAARLRQAVALLERLGIGPERMFLAGEEDQACFAPASGASGRFSAEAVTGDAPHADLFWRRHWPQAGRVTRAALEAWLGGLPEQILRIKGIVSVADHDHPVLVQRAGAAQTLAEAPGTQPCGLVAIGRPPLPDLTWPDTTGFDVAVPTGEPVR